MSTISLTIVKHFIHLVQNMSYLYYDTLYHILNVMIIWQATLKFMNHLRNIFNVFQLDSIEFRKLKSEKGSF